MRRSSVVTKSNKTPILARKMPAIAGKQFHDRLRRTRRRLGVEGQLVDDVDWSRAYALVDEIWRPDASRPIAEARRESGTDAGYSRARTAARSSVMWIARTTALPQRQAL